MDKTIKNYFGASAVFGITVFAIAVLIMAGSYFKSINKVSSRIFSVSGEGKIIAIPDVAQFNFSVLTQGGKNIADLQQENSQKMNNAIDFLKNNGIEDKDIKTQNYNLEPRYQHFTCPQGKTSKPCPPAEIVGYSISQTISVKIRNFDAISEVLSGIVESGANSVSQLSFTVDDPTALQNQAEEEALTKAKKQAEMIASVAGFKVGKLVSIDPSSFYPVTNFKRGFSEMSDYGMGMGGMMSPSIEPGSQEITANVTLTYEIR